MKVIIDDKLAVASLEDRGWDYGPNHWMKKMYNLRSYNGWRVVDCRNVLKDEPGNSLDTYLNLIFQGSDFIKMYGKVVVGCHAGISRSPAIAAGILCHSFGYPLQDAIDLVKEKNSITLIEPTHLKALEKLYGGRHGYFGLL